MSSRLPAGGDLYGFAGAGGGGGSTTTPFHLPYLRSPDLSSTTTSSAHIKRPISDVVNYHNPQLLQQHQQQQQQQQQHNLHHHHHQQLRHQALLLRSVKPKLTHYLHPSPISPFDLPTSSSSSSSTSTSTSATTLLNHHPRLLQHHHHHHHHHQQQQQPAKTQIKTQLEELEKQLLDDDDDDDESPSPTTIPTSEWTDAMHTLISIPPSSPPSTTSSCTSTSPSKLLHDAAAAIADGNTDAAATLLCSHQPSRSNPEQRLCGYLATALSTRLTATPPAVDTLCHVDHLRSTHLLHQASPCFKFPLLAANLAILNSSSALRSIHIVDFDVGDGSQYFSLVHSLSSLPCPSSLTISAVADPLAPYTTNTSAPQLVRAAGDRLAKAAELTGHRLRLRVLPLRPSELTRDSLGCGPDDPLIVNLAFHLHRVPDESVTPANPRDELLRRVKALHPRVVTLVEEEMNGNTTPFLSRFSEAYAYYSALFHSLDATFPGSPDDRNRVECCLAAKASNAVAGEGSDRLVRCEVFGKWRARMSMAGFHPSPVGSGDADLRALLGRVSGFSVNEDHGALSFGYSGRTLTVASAWH